jgi:hypothetical protein
VHMAMDGWMGEIGDADTHRRMRPVLIRESGVLTWPGADALVHVT